MPTTHRKRPSVTTLTRTRVIEDLVETPLDNMVNEARGGAG